ncbi:MAG: (5-formylfuran-3-yl)methyl phosphate synthase, partial [Gemmatimonadales bacterium]
GALGAVTPGVLRSIYAAVHPRRPVSAALGDAVDEAGVARRVSAAAAVGVAYVKVGFRRITSPTRVLALVTAAAHATRARGGGTRVVVVAYADAARAGSLFPRTLAGIAARGGAAGVLLDTAFKDAGGLFELLAPETVREWVDAAHAAGLTAGLAGGLGARDLATAGALGADLVGVRGAACDGGRTGCVSRSRVAQLSALLGTRDTLVEREPQCCHVIDGEH